MNSVVNRRNFYATFANKENDSWRSVMDIAVMAQSDNKEGFDPEKNVFRFDLEKELLYDEEYAESPILVRLQLAPEEGLHPRGIEDIRSAEEWKVRENAEAAEFLAGYGIKGICNPQEASGDEILKEETRRILIGTEELKKRRLAMSGISIRHRKNYQKSLKTRA